MNLELKREVPVWVEGRLRDSELWYELERRRFGCAEEDLPWWRFDEITRIELMRSLDPVCLSAMNLEPDCYCEVFIVRGEKVRLSSMKCVLEVWRRVIIFTFE